MHFLEVPCIHGMSQLIVNSLAIKLEKKNNFAQVIARWMHVAYFPVTCSLLKIRNIKILFMNIKGKEREFTSRWVKYGVFQVTGSNPVQKVSAFRSRLSSGLWLLGRQVFASESTSSAQEESQAADFEDELLSYAQEWAVEHQFDRAVQLLNLAQN